MSLVTIADVTAIIAPGITDEQLQDVIDREEDWLAFSPEIGIGQLEGERTETMWPGDPAAPVWLARPVDAVGSGDSLTVTDAGAELDPDAYVLLPPTRLEQPTGLWVGPVQVTYTPTDALRVQRVVIELVRATLSASPFQSESAGGHSAARNGAGLEAYRRRLALSLHHDRGPKAMRIRSSFASARVSR